MRKGLLIVCIVVTGITTIVLKDIWYSTDEDQQAFKWGISFNSERLKRNIPPVEKHWIEHGNDSSTIYWSNKKNTIESLEPFHFYKTVKLKDENIRSEEDAFHYEYSDSISYRVIVTYNYDSAALRDSYFITYFNGSFPPTERTFLTKLQLDSILDKWAINLYYR